MNNEFYDLIIIDRKSGRRLRDRIINGIHDPRITTWQGTTIPSSAEAEEVRKFLFEATTKMCYPMDNIEVAFEKFRKRISFLVHRGGIVWVKKSTKQKQEAKNGRFWNGKWKVVGGGQNFKESLIIAFDMGKKFVATVQRGKSMSS